MARTLSFIPPERSPQVERSPDCESNSVELRLRRAVWAYTTRRVPHDGHRLTDLSRTPEPGDLVLARIDTLGHHTALQLPDGRRRTLFEGDEIVVAYGNRYAPNQFEAAVPKTLGPCDLVAAGGLAAKALSWHSRITRRATRITPQGLLARTDGEPVNLRDHALPPADRLPASIPPTIAVVGTAMDSGKTQTCGYLVHGLARGGRRVGYAKITGTGAGGDPWFLRDAGADPVLDFTDAGLVSTYLASAEVIERSVATLIHHLVRSRAQAIVLEVADGALQGETATLLASDLFRTLVSGIIFTASDAMGALAGAAALERLDLPLVALGGVLTASPLQRREAAKATGLPVFSRQDLALPENAARLLALARERGAHVNGSEVLGNGSRVAAEAGVSVSVA